MVKAKTEKKTSPKKPTAAKTTITAKAASAKSEAPKVAPKKVEAPKATSAKSEAPKKAVSVTPARKAEKVVNPATGGVGRRKSSVARAWITRGKGDVVINGRKINEYFLTAETQSDAVKALVVCSAQSTYKITVNVKGGGPCSQAGAVRLGIARALLADNEGHRIVLREHGLLTVDARVKERKKPGQKAARRKFQFVKR